MGQLAYLIDTNILSEPMKPDANPQVLALWERHGPRVRTASVVIHEMRHGIAKLPESRRKTNLSEYLHRLMRDSLAVLPYDVEAAL